MTLTIEIEPELEMQLREEAARSGLDTTAFIQRTLKNGLRRGKKLSDVLPPHLSRRESELLQRVNLEISEETWRRYRELKAKRRDETLTLEEHAELIDLSDQIEIANAERIERLGELADLWQTSLRDVMKRLGIKSPGYE